MGIQEEINKRDNIPKEPSKAELMYKKQINAIQGIKHTDWYKEMIKYWERELEAVELTFPIVQEKDLKALQNRYILSSKFLTFLKNLEKVD